MCFNTRRSYASENVKFQSWIYLTTTFILFCQKKKLHLYCKIFLIKVYDSNVCWRFLKKKKRMLEISHRISQSNFHQGPEGNVFDKLTVLNE